MAWAGSAMTLPALLFPNVSGARCQASGNGGEARSAGSPDTSHSLCGCDLTAEYLPDTEEVRVQFPAAAPFIYDFRFMIDDLQRTARERPQAERQRAAESPKLRLCGAAPQRPANSKG